MSRDARHRSLDALDGAGVRIDLQAQGQRSVLGHEVGGDRVGVSLRDVADLEVLKLVRRDVVLQERPNPIMPGPMPCPIIPGPIIPGPIIPGPIIPGPIIPGPI
jgi:hypothetical protein